MLVAAIVIASIFTYLAIGVATAVICYRYDFDGFRNDPEFMIPFTVFVWIVIWTLLFTVACGKVVTRIVRMFVDVPN